MSVPNNADAIRYLVEQAGAGQRHHVEIGGMDYAINRGQNGSSHAEIPPAEPRAETLRLSSLDSLIQYLAEDPDGLLGGTLVHVESPWLVSVKSPAEGRHLLRHVHAAATHDPGSLMHEAGRWMEIEDFRIHLMTHYLETEGHAALLEATVSVSGDAVITTTDDGVGQRVEHSAGSSLKASKRIINPVKLIPLATFPEVDSPAISYVFRVREGGEARLVPVNLPDWMRSCVKLIELYLADNKVGLPVLS